AQIGEVNSDMQSAKIALRKAEDRKGDVVAAKAELDALEKSYQALAAEARQLRATDAGGVLSAKDGAGRAIEIPVSAVVRFWQPNV
ncbi:MAG TPA: hypothetical protein DCY41_04255, partial [Opitutae bacterium]|nr:hypothetical protein [Opitutae bacterium]